MTEFVLSVGVGVIGILGILAYVAINRAAELETALLKAQADRDWFKNAHSKAVDRAIELKSRVAALEREKAEQVKSGDGNAAADYFNDSVLNSLP